MVEHGGTEGRAARLVVADSRSEHDVVLNGSGSSYSATGHDWIGFRLEPESVPLPIDMLKRMLQIIVRSLCITETWLQLSAGGLSLRRIPDGKIVLPEVIERGKKRIIFRCGTNDLSKVVALYEHYMIYEDLFFIFQPSDHAHELASEFFPEVCQAFLADVRRFGKAFLYLNTEVMHMWGLLPTSVDGQAAATQLRRLNEMKCPRA